MSNIPEGNPAETQRDASPVDPGPVDPSPPDPSPVESQRDSSHSDSSHSEPGPPPKDKENLSSSLDAFMPAVLFLIFNRWLGLAWAIGAATVWSLKAAYSRRKKGIPIGKLLPIVTIYIVARGTVGIITDSATVYFGIGIATKFAIGLAVAGMTLFGRNILVTAAPYIFEFPKAVRDHPIYHSALNRISYAAAVYYAISAGFDIWLYSNSSVNGYVLIRLIVNWPLGLAVFWGAVFYLVRKLRQVPEFPGLLALLEARMSDIEAQMEARSAKRKQRKERKLK